MAEFNLDMNVDERDFVRGVENASEALETIIDSMDDVEKESLRSTKKIEAGLKDVTEAAKDTEKAARPIGKGFKDASKESQEGLDDLKENSKSNAKEVAASFDGSAQSIVDGFQGLAAEAFEGFGVAGIAAGVAVAAGIGLATAAFEQNAATSEAAKQRIRDFGLSIIESGNEAASLEFISDNLKAIITDSDEATKKFKDIEDFLKRTPALANKAGLLALAYSGNAEAIKATVSALEDEKRAQEEAAKAADTRAAVANTNKANELQREIDALKSIQTETERAQAIEQAWAESGGAALDQRRAMLDTVNAAYDEAAGNTQDFINEETGLFDTGAYIKAMQEREAALTEYQNALAGSNLTAEAKAFLNSQGAEAAAQMLKGYSSGDAATKKELNRIWTEAGKEGSGAAKKTIDETFKTPTEAKVNVKVDDTSLDLGRRAILDKLTRDPLQIPVKFVTPNGKVVY